MSDLPNGWEIAPLNDVVISSIGGMWGSATDSKEATLVRVIRAAEFKDWAKARAHNAPPRFVPNSGVASRRLDVGDIVLEVSGGGPTQPVGRTVLIDEQAIRLSDSPLICSNFCRRLVLSEHLDSQFVRYQLHHLYVRGETDRYQRATTNIRNLQVPHYLEGTKLAIPPRAEQQRIVRAIEERFSRLDAGVAALERARDRLRLLRDRALLALVSETGDVQRLGDIAEIRLGRQRSPKNHVGPRMRPYLRAANVTWNGLDLRDVKLMNFSSPESSVYELQVGDVLVAEASGSASEVGKPAIWDGTIANCCFQNTLLRVRSDRFLAEYLYFVLLAHARGGTFARASRGVGIHHLSKSGLSGLAVPVPTLAQQEAIVQRAQSIQAAVARLLADVEKQFARVRTLQSAILAAAFSGNLSPQDPNDEPAGILLERVARASSSFNGDKAPRNRELRTVRAQVPA